MSEYVPPDPPPGCRNTTETERQLNAVADAAEAAGLPMLKDGGITAARGNQLLVTAVRARHLAGQLAARREDRSFDEYLMQCYRELGVEPPGKKKR